MTPKQMKEVAEHLAKLEEVHGTMREIRGEEWAVKVAAVTSLMLSIYSVERMVKPEYKEAAKLMVDKHNDAIACIVTLLNDNDITNGEAMVKDVMTMFRQSTRGT